MSDNLFNFDKGRKAVVTDNLCKSYGINQDQNTLEKAETHQDDTLEKGGKRAVIGEKRMFAGREYIKTAQGWKFHGKGTGVKAQEHAKSSSNEEVREDTSIEDKISKLKIGYPVKINSIGHPGMTSILIYEGPIRETPGKYYFKLGGRHIGVWGKDILVDDEYVDDAKIGEIRYFGGQDYVKTAQRWKKAKKEEVKQEVNTISSLQGKTVKEVRSFLMNDKFPNDASVKVTWESGDEMKPTTVKKLRDYLYDQKQDASARFKSITLVDPKD